MNNSVILAYEDTSRYPWDNTTIIVDSAYTHLYVSYMSILDSMMIISSIIMIIGLLSIVLLPKLTYPLLFLSSLGFASSLWLIFVYKGPSIFFFMMSLVIAYLHIREETYKSRRVVSV